MLTKDIFLVSLLFAPDRHRICHQEHTLACEPWNIFHMYRWLQYTTSTEGSHISSDILILFIILLEISFCHVTLSDQISNRISVRVTGI